jgi:ABC-type polysaccharide/polyol phosphate transport system ATPase subunit
VPFIRLDHVTVRYDLDYSGWNTLKDFVLHRLREGGKRTLRHVDALRDVTLEVSEGERLGVLGRNGAGKSTLLRTMAGIYPPLSGEVTTVGRVRALFDLSLGFEPDATGRENIFFRGLLLGEKPEAIRKKMAEIAEFTEIGDFLDVPVKCYSSGMLVRLAFAISSAIEGDILLLDEVVAAGDLHFQEKAKKRLLEMIDRSRLLVLVSHDLGAIREICNRAVWLDGGKVRMDGLPADVVAAYTAMESSVV